MGNFLEKAAIDETLEVINSIEQFIHMIAQRKGKTTNGVDLLNSEDQHWMLEQKKCQPRIHELCLIRWVPPKCSGLPLNNTGVYDINSVLNSISITFKYHMTCL